VRPSTAHRSSPSHAASMCAHYRGHAEVRDHPAALVRGTGGRARRDLSRSCATPPRQGLILDPRRPNLPRGHLRGGYYGMHTFDKSPSTISRRPHRDGGSHRRLHQPAYVKLLVLLRTASFHHHGRLHWPRTSSPPSPRSAQPSLTQLPLTQPRTVPPICIGHRAMSPIDLALVLSINAASISSTGSVVSSDSRREPLV